MSGFGWRTMSTWRVVARLLAALAAIAAWCAPAAAATPGVPVPGFGTGGIVTQPIDTGDARASAVTLQPDGKIVAALNLEAPFQTQIGIARFTPTGQLDPGFGTGGATYKPAFGFAEDLAVAVDHKGRAVVVGTAAAPGADAKLSVTRYDPQGFIDTSFNPLGSPVGQGYAEVGIPDQDVVGTAVAITPDDGIVVAGHAGTDALRQGFVARFTAAGVLDSSFNPTGPIPGVRSWPVADDGGGFNAIALDGQRILAAGWSRNAYFEPQQLTVVRLTANGSSDPTFAAAGTRQFRAPTADGDDAELTAIALDRAGSILVAGSQAVATPAPATRLVAARLTSSGAVAQVQALAAGDGGDAKATAIAARPHGGALIAGRAANGGRLVPLALRLRPDGVPDAAFGNAVPGAPGFVFVPIGSGNAVAAAAVRDRDDTLVLAGHAAVGGPPAKDAVALVRLGGQPPVMQASASSLAFGDQTVGTTSAARSVTISNPGDAVLRVGGIAAPAGFAVADPSKCATATLEPFGACTFQVAFRPAAAGPASGRVTVASNAPAVTIQVAGTGRPAGTAAPALDPASLAFGEQLGGTRSAPRDVALRNRGTAPMSVRALRSSSQDVVVTDGGCGAATVPAGGSCTFRVVFAPRLAGDVAATVTAETSAGSPTLAVTGHGQSPPDSPGGETVPSPALKAAGRIVESPRGPGSRVVVQPVTQQSAGSPTTSYLWSTTGPKPSDITAHTDARSPEFVTRPPRAGQDVYVWAVDKDGRVSAEPGVVRVMAPASDCAAGQLPGDLKLGWVHLRSSGCIRRGEGGADFVVPLAGGGAAINGLDIQCPAGTATCELRFARTGGGAPLEPGQDRPYRLTSSGPVRLRMPNGQQGPVDFGNQTIDFTWNGTPEGGVAARAARDLNGGTPLPRPPIVRPRPEVLFGQFQPPAGTKVAGVPIDGKVTLSLFGPEQTGGEPGMKLTMNLALGGRTPVSLQSNANSGPQTEGTRWEVDIKGFAIAPLMTFPKLKMQFQAHVEAENGWPAQDNVFSFEGTAVLLLTGWSVEASGRWSGGNPAPDQIALLYERNTGTGTIGKEPTKLPFALDSLSASYSKYPCLQVGGGVTVSLDVPKGTFGGGFKYADACKGEPWRFFVEGYFPFPTFPTVTMNVALLITGEGFGIRGAAIFEVKKVIRIDASVYVYFASRDGKFRAEVGGGGLIRVFGWTLASAKMLANSEYLAACGSIVGIEGWGYYNHTTGKGDGGFGGCGNIAKYSYAPELAGLARRSPRATAAVSRLRVPRGLSWANLEVTSADGVARARVAGPGIDYTTPETAGVSGRKGDRVVSMADPDTHRTVIGLRAPKPGRYTVSTVAGAPAVVDARLAYSRPSSVRAKVSGSGAKRLLRYRVDAPKGAVVRLRERAGAKSTDLRTVKPGAGKLRFKPDAVPVAKREITAEVTVDGIAQPTQVLARYRVRAERLPRPRKLSVRLDRRRARAVARWAKVSGAASYRVTVRGSDGRRQRMELPGTQLELPSVYAGGRFTVRVEPRSSMRRLGAARQVVLRIPGERRRR